MDQDKMIRSLRLQLRLERTLILLVVLFFLGRWGLGFLQDRPYVILADGRPIAHLATSEAAARVLESVKKSVPGVKPSDITFAEQVRIGRASGSASVTSETDAVKNVSKRLSLRVTKYAILVGGAPAVAVNSKEDAGAALEAAKQKFGSLAENLMEEPQFKEQVKVEEMSIDPALYRSDVSQSLDLLLSGGGSGSGYYVVSSGDVASKIASRLGVSLAELAKLNPGRDLDKLQIGDQIKVSKRSNPSKPRLTVVVRDLRTKTEAIPFRTESVSSMKMYAGKQLVLSPGRNGLRKIVVAETYENGVRSGWEVVEETTIRNPIPRRVAIGIRSRG